MLITLFYELFTICVDFLRYPETGLRDELFVASAEMKGRLLGVVQGGFDGFVHLVEKTDAAIVEGEGGELLVLGGCLKHFE
jgi:hypothetical protein